MACPESRPAPCLLEQNGIRLDVLTRKLSGARASVRLTVREAGVLIMLAAQREPCSRSMLYQRVFGRDWSPGDRSLDVHVCNLRSKIAQVGGERSMLQTRRNRGYALRAARSELTEPGS